MDATPSDALALENVRHTAAKDLSTPVSYLGSARMIWPWARGSSGILGAQARRSALAAGAVLYWLLVTTVFYLLLFALVPTIVPTAGWLIFTVGRRRSIHNARAALAARSALSRSGDQVSAP